MLTCGQKTSQDASCMTSWDETLLFHHVFSLLPMFFWESSSLRIVFDNSRTPNVSAQQTRGL